MSKIISTNPGKNYEVLGEVKVSSKEEIKTKVEKAQKAKKPWKMTSIKARIEILRPILEEFKARMEEIALLETKETGLAIKESLANVQGHLAKAEWFLDNAELALSPETTYQDDKYIHQIIHESIGVAAVITPWNHPFGMFIWGVFPNLLVGNPLVFKISEECPLVGKLIEEIMLAHEIPDGVFSEIYGDGEIGWELVNQEIDLIWFTGSTQVGQKLYKLAGEKFIKAVLELGGSNPCIVFEDVNVQEIVKKIYFKRFKLCGQTCDSLKRLIVHKSFYNEVVELLKKEIQLQKVGNPEEKDTDLGSLAAKRQVDLLKSQVQDAVDKNAQIITGGESPQDLLGAYYLPTILTNIRKDMKVWREEVFGPVLPIISFEIEEDAIELANDTIYGLGSVIFTNDKEKAKRVASQIDSGTVEINQASHWLHCNPFGGYKKSGIGREHGLIGFKELCQIKLISSEK